MDRSFVMAGFIPAIHVLAEVQQGSRGCPGQARAWRDWAKSTKASRPSPAESPTRSAVWVATWGPSGNPRWHPSCRARGTGSCSHALTRLSGI